jgi:predicted aspartyl protease
MRRPARIFLFLASITLAAVSVARATPLEFHGNRLFVTVTINGIPAEALLDSAAEMTFVDTKLAARLKLVPEGSETAKGSGGTTEVQFAKNVDIEAAGVRLSGMTVALLDMTDLSKRVVDKELQIILGREFFDAGRVRIDIEGRTIDKVDSAKEPDGTRLPLVSARGIESFPCTVEGVATRADIDLGNGNEVLVGRAFAEKHGLLAPGRVVDRKSGGGIGGSVDRDIVILKSLEIAGTRFENVRAAIDPQSSAGEINVGTSILRRFILVIDFPAHAVWLRER